MPNIIVCPNCKQSLPAPDLTVGVINNPEVSWAFMVHVKGIECLCGVYLLPAITAVPVEMFTWVLADRPIDSNGSRLITPGLKLVD